MSTKTCNRCGCAMIELRHEDKKVCSNGKCANEIDWPLGEGQQFMFKRNVEPLREPREMRL